MKKSLLSLAVLGSIAAPAFAQSSLTIFGVIDVAVSKSDDGQSNLSYGSDWQVGRRDAWTVHPGTSSRLGVRGVEDLGQGWKANFLLDHRFLPDSGMVEPRDGVTFTNGQRNYNAGFWNAQAYVGLQSLKLGEVRMGRIATPTFNLSLASDPWGMDYNLAGLGGFTRGGNFIGAANNAVSYFTPNFAGFTGQLLVAAGEGGAAATGTGAPNGRNVGAALRYAGGPLLLGLAYNDSKRTDAILNRTLAFGGTYDFGLAKAFFNYSMGQNNIASNEKTKTGLLGAHVPLGKGFVRTGVGYHAPAVGYNPNAVNPGATVATTPNPYAAFPVTQGQTSTKFGLGYVYEFSKRTNVYADVGTNKTETYSRSNGVQAGLKHSF